MSSADSSPPKQEFPRAHVVAAFAAVYVVWGSTYLAIRYAVATMPPTLMVGTRFAISGVLLYAWARVRGSPRPNASQWRAAAITGVLLLCCGNGSVSWAEQRVPSGLAALIVAVVPLWMVVLDWLRPRGVRPSARVVAGVLLGLVGLVVLVGPSSLAGHGSVDSRALMVLMAGSLAWAAGSVYSRHAPLPRSAALSTGMQMIAGSSMLLVIGAASGEIAEVHPAAIAASSWIGWIYLVTFGSLVGFTAYLYLLRAVTPAKASTYAYVNPVVAVFLGWAIAGEPVTARTIAGAAIILGSVAIISLSQSTRARERS
jgi:drug/metabolite transporter (DMT)-like permease